ncbi:MBL fold metallo-hydrolase [Yinghuangia sp. ASG 101]|uniref:MBL fold metallo-hydrolase n=1 Tax=Yinghuangia sp. ASG 101 TaxID=2896848 RepID=UPI001E2FDCCE|nr:MBL fold metallo-hydrolase [Yinghuangia sp. ASG 101]UGQ10666.1 MBL fold metallo-hydrolase [Yinghuangia sp. ASG 101]
MIIAGFPAGSFGTNCYVVAPDAGEECVIVDPGQDAFDGVQEIIRENRLRPVAVLLTHGHLDHMWSVVPVCDEHKVPAWIHPDDRDMLADPIKGFSRVAGQQLFGGMTFTEPDDVRELTDGATLDLAGLEFTVRHAPGHTGGSVTFGTGADADIPPVLYSGDLLFAGSIGRTDLPGGDHAQMLKSLTRVVLPLPDETVVLSGHGPQTTIGRERATNPYLQELAPQAGPRRGM